MYFYEIGPGDPINVTHLFVHHLEDEGVDPEETLFLALNRAEYTLLGLGLMTLDLLFPCLRELNDKTQRNIVEIIRVQRPDWIEEDDDEEA